MEVSMIPICERVRGRRCWPTIIRVKSALATIDLAIAVGNQMGKEDILRKIIQVASDVTEVLCFAGKIVFT
jgi:hypothetical protein